jgi:hypothetical protein
MPNVCSEKTTDLMVSFADLEYLGKSICQRTKLDTLLKNMMTAENPESILHISSEAQ